MCCSGSPRGCPRALYTGAGIERYLRSVLTEPGRSDDFSRAAARAVPDRHRPRHLRADRVRRGRAATTCRSPRPCARRGRCRWSTRRCRSKGRELIDGGIVSTTNLDIAVEAGAKLVVVINPIVPFVNDFTEHGAHAARRRARAGSPTWASPQIGYQAFKLLAHQRLHEMAERWEERYPGVDIVLIEPEPADELMFETSMMNFTSRVEIARHGFESVTGTSPANTSTTSEICRAPRPGDLGEARRRWSSTSSRARRRSARWRKILEGTTGALLRQGGSAAG